MPATGRPPCFGYVQGTCRPTTANPNGGCSKCLPPRGCRPISRSPSSPRVAKTSPGLPRYLNPQAEHLLDWFHLTMRITVLTQLAKGLRSAPERSANIARELQRQYSYKRRVLKWFLRHGDVFRARTGMCWAMMGRAGSASA